MDDASNSQTSTEFPGKATHDLRSDDEDTDRRDKDEVAVMKTYEPLPEGAIRILHLLPGVDGEDIRCELVNISLDEKPHYEAISYAWGSSFNLQKIILNGKACLRRHNLLDCLHTLRHPIDIRVLWCDALCINQANVLEKSSQIKLMPRIYRSASKTLIWLGNDGTYASPHFYVSLHAHFPICCLKGFLEQQRIKR
jgi:hypothetical protein